MNIAVFPGSFDPITLGHIDIINRALPLFDKVIIAIGTNSSKKDYFPIEDRKAWIEDVFKNDSKVAVDVYDGLTAQFAEDNEARYLIRGIRSGIDFEYEEPVAILNKQLNQGLETILFVSNPIYRALSSTIVREIHKNGGDVSSYLPENIKL